MKKAEDNEVRKGFIAGSIISWEYHYLSSLSAFLLLWDLTAQDNARPC